MFGFNSKQDDIDSVANNISAIVSLPLTSVKNWNNGTIPNFITSDNYVLGYHFSIAAKLYHMFIQNTSLKEGLDGYDDQMPVMIKTIAIAFGINIQDVESKLMPLMTAEVRNPDFMNGIDDAENDFEKWLNTNTIKEVTNIFLKRLHSRGLLDKFL
jgi:hypothetical protein